MATTINTSDTITLIPSGYSNLSNMSESSYPIENAYADSSNSSYARFSISSSSTGSIYYLFTAPDIPSSANIDSVTATAKLRVGSTSSVTNTVCQLYSGSTAKGSSISFDTTSASEFNLSTGSSWTVNDLQDLRLYIAGYGSSRGRSRYIYFYGATIEITYSINGTQYEIYVTSNVSGITVSPASAPTLEGGEVVAEFYVDDISDYIVTDNNIDVTSQLVRQTIQTGDTITATPNNYTYTDISSYYASDLSDAIGYSAENYSSSTSNVYSSGSGTIGYAYYTFDLSSIPSNATISSVTCAVAAHAESTSNSNECCKVQLCYNESTMRGDELDFSDSTSIQVKNIEDGGTWTLSELDYLSLRLSLGYYGGLLNGATLSIAYTVPTSSATYYYTYTLSNIDADHTIILDAGSIYIPPEEDPTINYYPITISAINAITDPGVGTTRVEEGSNQTIIITPSDPLLTLATDNGVDISDQLVYTSTEPAYSIDSVSGASYGFTLNSDGYYESTNAGVSNTAALARINLDLPTTALVTITYINYAEATYDYGVFGNIDSALTTSYSVSSDDAKLICSSSSDNSSSPQTITYNVEAGTHFIDIKYRKDQYTDSNNDSLQFKVEVTSTGVSGGYYTYTISNLDKKHSLMFVFGDVTYYIINSFGTSAKLYPDGNVVVLPGDSYRLRIIPDDASATVTLTDNGTNRTSQMTSDTGTDKNGDPITNYLYELSNISAAHKIVVSCVSASVTTYTVSTSIINGELDPDGSVQISEGEKITIMFTGDEDCPFTSFTINGTSVTPTVDNGVYTYTIDDIQENKTIVVVFGDPTTMKIFIKDNGTWTQYSKVYVKINGSWVEQTNLSGVFSTSANYVKGN